MEVLRRRESYSRILFKESFFFGSNINRLCKSFIDKLRLNIVDKKMVNLEREEKYGFIDITLKLHRIFVDKELRE